MGADDEIVCQIHRKSLNARRTKRVKRFLFDLVLGIVLALLVFLYFLKNRPNRVLSKAPGLGGMLPPSAWGAFGDPYRSMKGGNIMTNLIAHCGTNYVTEDAVRNVPVVAGTETWQPIHHSVLVKTLEKSVVNAGMHIQSRRYSLSKDGLKMFGVWILDRYDTEMSYAFGLRNSMNKTLAAGVCAGTNVLVCDNLAFMGDLVQLRRHTKLIHDDLPKICEAAVQSIATKLRAFAQWHKQLRTYVLRRVQAELLTFKAIERGIINPSQFKTFFGLYFEPNAQYGSPDLYCWHEAVTELLRGKSLFMNFERNRKLNRLCQEYISCYGNRL